MSELKPGLYATFETTQGNITCQLFPDQAPKTVANFVGLAGGTLKYVDPKTHQSAKGRFYDGLAFHRVIPNFMIQGGCPLGNGTGGPGFQFEDEFAKGLEFDQPGRLAMANAGPNTNGSQFFITVAPTTWLNKRHTIFGQVVEGQDVVEKISAVPHDRLDRPATPVVLKTVKILEMK
jgi:peptidyl-prolyl cis-trans isomerase A (cyclophilin A)